MNRVETVDALRGFAVVAIMLLYFIEHFIMVFIQMRRQKQPH